MADESLLATAKEFGAYVGAALGAFFVGWRAHRHRQEQRRLEDGTPELDGAERGSRRDVTRGEWHYFSNLVNRHENRITKLQGLATAARDTLEDLDREQKQLRALVADHLKESSDAMNAFARLEERFAAHVRRWEDGAAAAREERAETIRRSNRVEEKIDELLRRE